MSVTRLKRKHRKNIARANNKQKMIKDLLRTPVLKNVDLEELKSRFGQTPVMAPAAKARHEAEQQEKAAGKAKGSSLLDTVTHAATEAAHKVQETASNVADAVTHSSVFEKAAHLVSDAVDKVKEVADDVAHSDVVEKASHLVSDAVDKVKETVSGDDAKPAGDDAK